VPQVDVRDRPMADRDPAEAMTHPSVSMIRAFPSTSCPPLDAVPSQHALATLLVLAVAIAVMTSP